MVQHRNAHLVRETTGRVEPVLIEGVQTRRRARRAGRGLLGAIDDDHEPLEAERSDGVRQP